MVASISPLAFLLVNKEEFYQRLDWKTSKICRPIESVQGSSGCHYFGVLQEKNCSVCECIKVQRTSFMGWNDFAKAYFFRKVGDLLFIAKQRKGPLFYCGPPQLTKYHSFFLWQPLCCAACDRKQKQMITLIRICSANYHLLTKIN